MQDKLEETVKLFSECSEGENAEDMIVWASVFAAVGISVMNAIQAATKDEVSTDTLLQAAMNLAKKMEEDSAE